MARQYKNRESRALAQELLWVKRASGTDVTAHVAAANPHSQYLQDAPSDGRTEHGPSPPAAVAEVATVITLVGGEL
jgi:hypothetical protein